MLADDLVQCAMDRLRGGSGTEDGPRLVDELQIEVE